MCHKCKGKKVINRVDSNQDLNMEQVSFAFAIINKLLIDRKSGNADLSKNANTILLDLFHKIDQDLPDYN